MPPSHGNATWDSAFLGTEGFLIRVKCTSCGKDTPTPTRERFIEMCTPEGHSKFQKTDDRKRFSCVRVGIFPNNEKAFLKPEEMKAYSLPEEF